MHIIRKGEDDAADLSKTNVQDKKAPIYSSHAVEEQ